MSQVELLTRAIKKLETLSDKTRYFEMNGWLVELVTTGTEANPQQEPAPLTSDDMLVTLHRTIDAQLAILKAALDDFVSYGGKPSKFFENDMALAQMRSFR